MIRKRKRTKSPVNEAALTAKTARDLSWQKFCRYSVIGMTVVVLVAGCVGGVAFLFKGSQHTAASPPATAAPLATAAPTTTIPPPTTTPAISSHVEGIMAELASRCVRATQNFEAPDAATLATDLPAATATAQKTYADQLTGCFASSFDLSTLWSGQGQQTATEPYPVMLTEGSDGLTATFNVRLRVTGPAWKYFQVPVACDTSKCWLSAAPTTTTPPTPS